MWAIVKKPSRLGDEAGHVLDAVAFGPENWDIAIDMDGVL